MNYEPGFGWIVICGGEARSEGMTAVQHDYHRCCCCENNVACYGRQQRQGREGAVCSLSSASLYFHIIFFFFHTEWKMGYVGMKFVYFS